MSDEWTKTGGTHSKSSSGYLVDAGDGGGSFEIAESDTKIEDDTLFVKVGAKAVNTTFPTKSDTASRDMTLQRDTYCIGLVLFRCSDGAVIGACIGAWDCG